MQNYDIKILYLGNTEYPTYNCLMYSLHNRWTVPVTLHQLYR